MVRLPPYFTKQGLKESYKIFFFELARYNEFFVRMIPFRPMTTDFNITDNCNSRCIACTSIDGTGDVHDYVRGI